MERFFQDLSLINQSVPIVESAAFFPWFIMKYVYVYMHARILMKRFFQDSFLMNQSVHIIDRILLISFTDACSFFHINHILVSFAGIQGSFAEMCRALLATCRANKNSSNQINSNKTIANKLWVGRYVHVRGYSCMGWLRSVGSLKWYVSFANEP